MSGMVNLRELVAYYKKTQIMVFGIAGIGLFGIPIAGFIIPILYGTRYEGTIYIFTILFLASLIFLISIPIHNAIIYFFSYPKLFFWLSLGHLVVISFFGWDLILRYGVVGVAFAVLIGSLFNFLIPLAWLLYKINNSQDKNL